MEHDLCFGCMEHTGANGGPCPKCGFDPAVYTVEPHQLKPGTLLKERYAVGRVLGEGGFGITYVGRDTLLDLKVAVKEFYMSGYVNRNNTYSTVVQASIGTHAEMFAKNREKFLQEARVLAKFANEDGIVGIRDFFQENNTAYIVMDFLSGGTMRDFLHRAGRLTWEQTHRILHPILLSLGNVHAHNIIHRDISPDNIMMTGDGKVKLLDFGAAREISQNDIKSLSVILKPGYAPEEQYRSKGQQGPWTDIYALCATMYRCLTGEVPDDSMERMFSDQLKSPFERGVAPIAISNVLMKGLSVRQVNRYQSISELCADIALAERDPHNAAIAAPGVPAARPVQPQPQANATVYSGPAQQSRPVSQPATPQTYDPNATMFAAQPPAGQRPAPRTGAPTQAPPRPAEPVSRPVVSQVRPSQPMMPNGAPVPPVSPAAPVSPAGPAPAGVKKAGAKKPARQKAAAQQEGASKKSKKKLLPVIAIAAVVIIALVILLSGGKKPSGSIPSPFNNYSFTLNDHEFELPIMLSELEKEEWEAVKASELDKKLSPGATSSTLTFTNGYGEISVRFENPTDSALPARDCPITYISISYYSLNDNYLHEDVNTASLANDMELYAVTLSDFKARAPKGYGVEKNSSYTYCTYEHGYSSYRMMFDDDKVLLSFSISCDVPEGFITNKVATVAPDFDEAAFRQEATLDWYVKCDGFAYLSSVYLRDLESSGWEVEEAPEYLASHTGDTAYLRASKQVTLTQNIYNPFDTAIVPDYCFVEKITFSAGSLSEGAGFSLMCGSLGEVSGETTMDEAIAMLDANGIFYTEDSSKLIIHPYGEEDSRTVTVSFSDDGSQLYTIILDASTAIRDFFKD